MDPNEPVVLPEFMHKHLHTLPLIMEFVATHSKDIPHASDEQLFHLCRRCLPMSDYAHTSDLLKFVQFMDISLAVRMVFGFIFHKLKPTRMDDMVEWIFSPGEFHKLHVAQQHEIYEHILDNLCQFT